ncbi:MAG TPA: PKD domain-containing protein, partial [Bacteroidales bacterium]|nr:PKD domain-containing protein [Bacteroidales bacterium]
KAHQACEKVFDPVTINEPAILSATVSSTNVTCKGANDGTITITNPQGGYGTYQYSINGGTTWSGLGSFTNLAPNTYNVRIRDAAHPACVIILNSGLVITEPAVLNADVTKTNVTCNGANDGTITITNTQGGYGTYEYTINGGASWQSSGVFTSLSPGFYNVQMRDAAYPLCVKILNGSLQITEPAVLNASVTKTNVTCNGAGDGTITISSPTGGHGTYEYNIGSGWQSSGSFTNLGPATYVVMIRDVAYPSCEIVLDPELEITEPAVLGGIVTSTNVTCFDAKDGTITISGATGGYGTYEYTIDGGTKWSGMNSFMNLAPGSYDVRIRDAAHKLCVVVLNGSLDITQPDVLNATVSKSNVTCFGGSDGSITISSPQGGYGTYEYSVNGGGSWQSSGLFTNLSPGIYNVLIRDESYPSCIITLSSALEISQPQMLSATVSKTDISCNGANDGIINITSPSGGYGTYEYNIGSGWQSSGNFTGLAPGTYEVSIRDEAHPSCAVVLYPNLMIDEPLILILTASGDVMLRCYGDMTGSGTFYAAGGTPPYTFTLISNTTGGTLATPGFNSQSFFGAGAGTVTIRVADSHGCTAQATINVDQPDQLMPGSISGDQVLCSGVIPGELTEASPPTGGPGSYQYQWQYATSDVGPFFNIAGANSVTYTPSTGATNTLYYRRMVTSGMCLPVYSNVVEIKVNPRPVAILTGGAIICPGESTTLNINLPVGTGPFEVEIENLGIINNYNSDEDIVVSPLVTTTYKLLSVTDANGCDVTAPSTSLIGTATVTVRDMPAIAVQPENKITCEFGMVTYSVSATGSDLTYQWYVDDGTGFGPVIDGGIYFGSQTPMLFLFGTNRLMDGFRYRVDVTGCGFTVPSSEVSLTVNTAPEILIQPKDSTVCQGNDASFSVIAQGTAIGFQWQVNKGAGFVNVTDDANFSGSTAATLNITNAPGSFNNYIFRVKISGTCGVPIYSNFVALRVNIPPSVSLNPVNRSICASGGPVYFTGNGSGMIDSLRWQVFSGGSWIDIHDDAVYSGTTTQQLALVNVPESYNGNRYRLALKAACANSYTNEAVLTVWSNPVVDFSSVSPLNACGGVPLVLNGNPTGGSGIYTQHIWTGDVGPLSNYFIQNPTFKSQIAGTYNLNYKVRDSNGCYADDNLVVNVDAPDAFYSRDITAGCTPLTVSFTKDMTGISEFWWDFGDGSPVDSENANPVHVFTNVNPASVEYRNVELRVKSAGGCEATYTSMITVYPEIDATFTASPAVICSGSSATFTALPGANRYFWEFGDGASGYGANVAMHIYTNMTTTPQIVQVKLTTTSFYSCTDTKTFDITVMPMPVPQFTAVPPSQVFDPAGNQVSFTNQTNAGTWSWLWRFGDGGTSTVENPIHTYTDVGTYDVKLKVSNANCSDSITHKISILPPPPIAAFDSIPSGCTPLTVQINNTSINTEVPGTKYQWDFGDGNTSTVKNPIYTYTTSGVYRITLVVTGPGGQSMKSQIVNAYVSPKSYFEVAPTHVFVNDERVRFFNLSTNADYFVWEFGDGDTSHVKDPYHKYMEEGVYDITLHAYSSNGCKDSWTLSPGVTVEPAGVIRFSSVFRPNKEGPIERTDLPTGGEEIDQFFFPPIRERVLDYKLQIFNRWGTLIFESHDINVPWNGYYKGKLCKQGVYVWIVEGKYANGQPFKKTGDVTLLH